MSFAMSQKEMNACQFLFERIYFIDHSGASFFGHLYNTFFIMKQMQCNEDACLGGLYHAVYGTEFYNYQGKIFNRDEVARIIGRRAESLVNYFSMSNRASVILDNSLGIDDETILMLTEILYANDLEQYRNIPSQHEHLNNLAEIINSYRKNIYLKESHQ